LQESLSPEAQEAIKFFSIFMLQGLPPIAQNYLKFSQKIVNTTIQPNMPLYEKKLPNFGDIVFQSTILSAHPHLMYSFTQRMCSKST